MPSPTAARSPAGRVEISDENYLEVPSNEKAVSVNSVESSPAQSESSEPSDESLPDVPDEEIPESCEDLENWDQFAYPKQTSPFEMQDWDAQSILEEIGQISQTCENPKTSDTIAQIPSTQGEKLHEFLAENVSEYTSKYSENVESEKSLVESEKIQEQEASNQNQPVNQSTAANQVFSETLEEQSLQDNYCQEIAEICKEIMDDSLSEEIEKMIVPEIEKKLNEYEKETSFDCEVETQPELPTSCQNLLEGRVQKKKSISFIFHLLLMGF